MLVGKPDRNDDILARLMPRDWLPLALTALGSLALVFGLGGLFNGISTGSRPAVMAGLINSVFRLATSTITAGGTIAALMLTTMSLMQHLDTRRMGARFLFNLRLTVVAALTAIAVSVITLLLTIFPAAGTEKFAPREWQVDLVYYALLTSTALMVGALAVTLSALYATVADVFRNLPREWVDAILATDESDGRSR